MNNFQFAADFLTQFEEDDDFQGKAFFNGQDSATFRAPCLVFHVTSVPLRASGTAAVATLTVYVHGLSSPTGNEDDPKAEAAHADDVAAVKAKLFGAGKAALLAALNALDRWDIRGWSEETSDPGTEGQRFLTPVMLKATVLEI